MATQHLRLRVEDGKMCVGVKNIERQYVRKNFCGHLNEHTHTQTSETENYCGKTEMNT